MANKLKLQHERRKVALRGAILTNRAKSAQIAEQTKRFRDELKSMSPKKSSNTLTAVPGIRTVKV